MQDHMRHLHRDLGQLNDLIRIVRPCVGKLPLPTRTGLRPDREDLRGGQEPLAMARMSRLRAWSSLRGRGNRLLRKRWIGRGGTIGVAGVLCYASFECSDARFLLLDDGEQLDDHLAHAWGRLFPTGGIQRKPHRQWNRSRHRTLSCHTTGGFTGPS
jgi:hypothetical protein